MEEFSEIVGDRSVHGAGSLQNESRRIDALGERWFVGSFEVLTLRVELQNG